MKTLLFAALLIAGVALIAGQAYACSCPGGC